LELANNNKNEQLTRGTTALLGLTYGMAVVIVVATYALYRIGGNTIATALYVAAVGLGHVHTKV
jgi:hypothetical protein